MNWLNVSFDSNQNYVVLEQAVNNALDIALKNYNMVRVVSNKVYFDENHSNVQIITQIKIKNKYQDKCFNLIKELSQELEEAIKRLIDKKPDNVEIVLKGFY
ncbi:hypothetical protein GE118_01860 [Mycoplasma sp. NEAQ87857]|uniref:MMB_0454 family protein n=1 Tax=Mycoplasma sp. NEAQ87857 TaxID=2683967 RepID=UPI001319AD8E|nr:hypothetical protein [Mycoplasma sp. NEAQ87857]QGZ97541.1 hypothetical protein GE118_01860 [Mycoplasma sp. NEAQ87857]